MTPTLKGDKDMKLLKIEDDKGHYFIAQDKFATVDKITKEDILRLVNLTLSEEEVEFDEYKDDNLKNQAHQIIYKSIFGKLQELKERRKEFKDDSDRLYLSEYERYRDEPTKVDTDDEGEDDPPPEETETVDESPPEDFDDLLNGL